ncbi:MAG: Single-stranded-DNA-specific exonuclease RecJ [Candidatus Magasanikbacteria bacterium GW2011_GWC2_45_8]|uniref:Single-stranded-DNA-specific exonuclease RecJ n=1 Tax=Candidatus Magasanikbacteria bacterium GW2011_GWC2_45_8 TaxID=1619050 RepID=A0A0G1MYR8_9BACT|nr:MAG: Single-stranded-DNA-specific exonuclease RecJ [Candidatus Magasanikbacteria bacterium GW2011_GWC2_45_8]
MQKKWVVLPPAPQEFLEQFPSIHSVGASLLYHRGLKTQETIDKFLSPDYSRDMHDPFLFKDMRRAVTRIITAIKQKEKIVVHGDYDADGVTASTILVSCLNRLGAVTDVFLPHREIDGYGLNMDTVRLLASDSAKLIITCDCGVSNTEEVALAQSLGVDVIITDHHSIPAKLPPAYAIVHPKIENETYPDKTLSGGGVAFKLMQGLMRMAPEALGITIENIESYEKWMLDLVAISSVADMVPLLGESRLLTKYGLTVLNKTRRLGLKTMLTRLNAQGRFKEFGVQQIGFQIAPRINAAGRMKHANTAYQLLMAETQAEAEALMDELEKSNTDRQKTSARMFEEAVELIEKNQLARKMVIVVYKDGWAPGLVGLIASRIKDQYEKPTFVMTQNHGEIMGSGRGIDAWNMIAAIQKMPELFGKFGGHPQACGLTLASPDLLESFALRINERAEEELKGVDVSPVLSIDAELSLRQVDWEFYDFTRQFEPFGQHNSSPLFLIRKVTIQDVRALGKDGQHLKLKVHDGAGTTRGVIGFCFGDEEKKGVNWCTALKLGDILDIVVEVEVNEWNGNRELQLILKDVRFTH